MLNMQLYHRTIWEVVTTSNLLIYFPEHNFSNIVFVCQNMIFHLSRSQNTDSCLLASTLYNNISRKFVMCIYIHFFCQHRKLMLKNVLLSAAQKKKQHLVVQTKWRAFLCPFSVSYCQSTNHSTHQTGNRIQAVNLCKAAQQYRAIAATPQKSSVSTKVAYVVISCEILNKSIINWLTL